MKRLLRNTAVVMCVVLGFFTAISVAAAKTERRFETGTCGRGSAWWTLTTYVDGCPVSVAGMDCSGKYFASFPNCQIIGTNPALGMAPTHTGVCDADPAISAWTSVLNYDDNYRPTWMAGQGCNGNYWIATTFTFEDSETSGERSLE